MRKRALIVGSTGTVGSAATEALVESERFEVHAVARQHTHSPDGIIPHEINLKTASIAKELSAIEFDYIVDCAQPRYVEGDFEDFGVKHLMNLEALCTQRTQRLIYSSGVWIYGHQQANCRIHERTTHTPFKYALPRMPIIDYLRNSSKYPWVQMILPSFIYGSVGPLQDTISRIRKDSAVVIDDDSIAWSVIERSDLGKAYLAVLENASPSSEYVLAEHEAIPIGKFHECIANALGKSIKRESALKLRELLSEEDFEIATSSQPVDSSLVRRELGWNNKRRFYRDFEAYIPEI